ncbi:MAG: AAA family ATPase [Actinomycetota bacterium]|nr:AAA family ATPase [Actinomycetota bacterium]
MYGLATSQVATEVLTAEGLTSRNVSQWLGTQERLSAGAAERGVQGGDEAWHLRARDLVVVDESAMTDTAALSAIHGHVEKAGAKLLLVGDHRQLAAVGAGGGMDLLAAAGSRYELTDARRFTAEWEREASLRLRAGDESVLREYFERGRVLDAGTRDDAGRSAVRAWIGDTLDDRRSLLLVDTNEQAADLSSQIRAQLVRLGRVEERGVRLGLQGTYAGVGDLVQARENAWHLAGHEGNRRAPLNRDNFRVTAVRKNGSMEVTTDLTGTDPDGGERLVLPEAYVAEHLALGYVDTIYTAQGATVDTTHSVVTQTTSPNALYVGMSRGREANTAHVTTLSGPDDPADGRQSEHSLHRDPVAVLATVLDHADPIENRSALAQATEAAEQAASTRTAAELLADAAQLAATERTAIALDRLVTDGALSDDQRARIAAEDGAAALTRVLRRAELAGHDPDDVLREAIECGSLTGSQQLTNVIYSRIASTHRFDPVGETWAEWVPRTDNPQWARYLDSLAAAADERADELGEQAVSEPPRWAVAAFGAVPDDVQARQEWKTDVGRIAAYREVRGHDDPDEALGPAPKPSQVEEFASYRAAWRSLGRPEIDREHLELSNGQLRMRVRAWEREQAAAPRYVANELAGTRQTAAHHRHVAALRRAEAQAAVDSADRDRLAGEAAEAAALADTLDRRAVDLQEVDEARARWLVHTAQTRSQAELSQAELSARDAAEDPDERVTAAQWKAAHDAAIAADEQHRDVTEDDIHTRPVDAHDADRDDHAPDRNAGDAAESRWSDLRDEAALEPQPPDADVVQVPDADATARSLDRAERVLDEISYRDAAEEANQAERRGQELTRWQVDDQAVDADAADDDELMDVYEGPAPVDGRS